METNKPAAPVPYTTEGPQPVINVQQTFAPIRQPAPAAQPSTGSPDHKPDHKP